MKQLFSCVLFLSIYVTACSQITITRSDMPSTGDNVRYSTTSNSINVNTTGPNMTWDFSGLVINGQGVDSFRAIYNVNPLYVLSFGITDYAIRTTNFPNTSFLQINNAYSFYKKTNSYLSIDGFGAEFNGIPIPAAYTVEDKVYQFPLTYGRMDTTPYDLKVTIPTVGTLHQVGKRYNSVDGWGTVITPYGTFQCLRIRSYTQENDSVTITALGTTIPIPRNTLTYQWLANGEKTPIVEVSGSMQLGNFNITSRRFRDNVRTVPAPFGVQADFRANHTVCTTRDTISFINRSTPFVAGTAYTYTITPANYAYVQGTTANSASPRVNFTAPGLYTVQLSISSPTGGTPAVSDTTKVDYVTVTYPTGVSDLSSDADIEIYPNPVSDMLTVRSSEQITEVILMNTLGQQVMTKTGDAKAVSYSVKSYEEGTYLLDVRTTSGHKLQKVVIQ